MRLTDLEQDCYRRLGINTTTPPTADTTRIRAYLNETQRELLRNKHFRSLRRRIITTASIANVPFMALPRAAVRVFGIQDRTNDYYLEEKPLGWIRTYDPSLRAVTANPWAYAIYDLSSPVFRQPSDASQLFVKSTAAGDTTQKAYVEGIRTAGGYQSENKLLNGTTAAGLAQTDTIAVNKFYLDGACVGDVSLYEDSGAGNQLATILAGQLYSRYSLLHLYPTPSAASTYYCDIEVHVEDMAQANDEPLLPEEFHHLLGLGARIKEYEKREKLTLMKELKLEMATEVSKMRTWINDRSGLQNSGSDRRRFSQLGAWFPPGT